MTLYLFLLSQTDCTGYDTFSDCVVVSTDAEKAKHIHPDTIWELSGTYDFWKDSTTWASSHERVNCVMLGGLTNEKYKDGDIVCASFPAG
jgi:hypothetical protein